MGKIDRSGNNGPRAKHRLELIIHTDSIKAVFAGHMHYDFVSELTPTLKQYIVNVDSGNIVTVQ